MEQPLLQLSYVGIQGFLKGAAATILLVNAIMTLWLRNTYEKTWNEFGKDPFLGEDDDDVWDYVDSQKQALIVLGVFTLLLLLVYTTIGVTLRGSGNTTYVYLAGLIAMGLGLLCSTISFFLMSHYTCDMRCYYDTMDKTDVQYNWQSVFEGKLADKWEAVKISSICAGVGFLVTLIGYGLKDCATWRTLAVVTKQTLTVVKDRRSVETTECKTTIDWNCIRTSTRVFIYVGLLAVTTGFAGAFNWFAYEVRELADGHDVSSKKLDLSHDDILNFLMAAGIGFIVTACGEAVSILLITNDVDNDAEPKTGVTGPRSV